MMSNKGEMSWSIKLIVLAMIVLIFMIIIFMAWEDYSTEIKMNTEKTVNTVDSDIGDDILALRDRPSYLSGNLLRNPSFERDALWVFAEGSERISTDFVKGDFSAQIYSETNSGDANFGEITLCSSDLWSAEIREYKRCMLSANIKSNTFSSINYARIGSNDWTVDLNDDESNCEEFNDDIKKSVCTFNSYKYFMATIPADDLWHKVQWEFDVPQDSNDLNCVILTSAYPEEENANYLEGTEVFFDDVAIDCSKK